MKKYWFEILLIIMGIILLCSHDPDPKNTAILQFIGLVLIVVAIIWFFIHYRMAKHDVFLHLDHPNVQNNDYKYQETRTNDEGKTNYHSSPQSFNTSKKEEERMRILDEQIIVLRDATKTQIIDFDDIGNFAEIFLNSKDADYIAGKLTCPLLSSTMTIKDIREKMDTMNFSDDQVITLFQHGSTNLRERLSNSCKNRSWNIPSRVFDYLMESDRMLLLTLACSEEVFTRLLDKMGPYELLGYRTKPKGDEEQDGILINRDGEKIIYYEDADTDVVYIAEQNFPNNDALRKRAFDKVFAGPCELTDIIGRLDNLTEYEAKKIFERGNTDEIGKIFDRNDSDSLVDYVPPKYAIKAVLGIIPSEYSDFIHENFNFENVDDKIWLELFEKLTPDELAGYRIYKTDENQEEEGTLTQDDKEDIPYYAQGDHDIINLIEDHAGDDENLRMAALQKVIHARCIKDIIESLDNITDNEAKLIMESKYEDAVEALLERNDSDDIIGNLPEDMAIKIRLEIIYSSASDNVKNNYQFNNSGAFMKAIEELSPYELLGYTITSKETGSSITDLEKDKEIFIENDADYDIIKLIEDEMGDDVHLRELAFNKICGAKNMVNAIARWDNMTHAEVAKIIERGFDEEMNALAERSDFDDDIKGKMPDNYIIRSFLLDNNDSLNDEFHERMDAKRFRQQVEVMVAELSNEKLNDDNEDLAVEDLSDDQVIRIALGLIDLDDYSVSFDSDDISSEYTDRLENDTFKAKVEKLTETLI